MTRICKAIVLAVAIAFLPFGAQAANISCSRSSLGNLVDYQDEVSKGDADSLSRVIDECFPVQKSPVQIVLSSSGGNMMEGLKMGRYLAALAQRRIVRVKIASAPGLSYCISACTFIFMGGGWREMPPGASFEPHGFSIWSGPRLSSAHSWPEADINRARLGAALQILLKHLAQEAGPPPGYQAIWSRLDEQDRAGAQAVYESLSRPQQQLLDRWDALLRVWLVEIERQTALHALLALSGVPVNELPPDFDPKRLPLTPQLLDIVLDLSLSRNRPGRASAVSTPAGAAIEELVAATRQNALSAVPNIWRLLESRQQDIDVRSVISHMFSTSILYTRALSREELCDSNLVNVGC